MGAWQGSGHSVTTVGNRFSFPTVMSTLTPNRGSSVLSQHLHTTKKILQDLRSGAKCVWSGGIAVTPDTAEVRQTNGIDTLVTADACDGLVRRSRARCFRHPPPHSILEEQRRTDQQNPSRNPRSSSGLLELVREGSKHNRTHPRMPGLERTVYIAVLLMDSLSLHGHGQNSRLRRTFKLLPHRIVTVLGQRPALPELLSHGRLQCYQTTQTLVHQRSARTTTMDHLPPILPCSPS